MLKSLNLVPQLMGLTYINLKVINAKDEKKQANVKVLVDSGAVYTVLPRKELLKLGIRPVRKLDFILADGTQISRELGNVIYDYQGIKGAAPVVFGEKGDASLLGSVSLESLGLVLNPFSRELKPMQMVL